MRTNSRSTCVLQHCPELYSALFIFCCSVYAVACWLVATLSRRQDHTKSLHYTFCEGTFFARVKSLILLAYNCGCESVVWVCLVLGTNLSVVKILLIIIFECCMKCNSH